MSKPFALVSDIHFHGFSAFSKVDERGINSRLADQLAEYVRIADELHARGGSYLLNAGDTMHVRGHVAPTVLNPVLETVRDVAGYSVHQFGVPGNHDLETKDVHTYSSAMTALGYAGYETEPNFEILRGDPERKALVVSAFPEHAHCVVMFPWFNDQRQLIETMRYFVKHNPPGVIKTWDAVIHAPLDGVLAHLDGHGLDPQEIADIGFNRVFAGHYHNHKELVPGKVWSIGAMGHQTWSDVGSLAGSMLVWHDRVEHVPSQLPRFLDSKSILSLEDIRGNYFKMTCEIADDSDLQKVRKEIEAYKPAGYVIHPIKKVVSARTGLPTSTSASLNDTVAAYATRNSVDAEVVKLCHDYLTKAREAVE